MRTVFAVVVALCVFWAAPAEADDATGKAYDDLKFVVEELISQEFAEGATVWLTCNSQYLPRYYGRTLQRLAQRQLGALKSTLRDDTIDAIADYAFWALSQEKNAVTHKAEETSAKLRPTDFFSKSLDWRIPITKTSAKPLHDPRTGDDICSVALKFEDERHTRYRRALLEYLQHGLDVNEPKDADSCNSSTSLACDLAQSLKAALQGKNAQAQAELLRFVVNAFFAAPETPAGMESTRERILNLLVAGMKDEKSAQALRELLRPATDALRGVKVTDLACTKTATPDDAGNRLEMLATADPAAMAATLACVSTTPKDASIGGALAELTIGSSKFTLSMNDVVKALASTPPNATDESSLRAFLCRMSSTAGAPPDGCAGPTPPAISGVLKIAGTLEWDVAPAPGRSGGLVIKPKPNVPPLAAVLTAARRYREFKDRLASALTAMFPDGPDTTPDPTKPGRRGLAILAMRTSSLLHDLDQLRLFSEEGKLDYGGLLDTTLRVAEGSPELCPQGAANPSCAQVRRMADYLRSRDTELHRLVTSAARRDYRTMALQLLDLALPNETAADDGPTCSLEDPPFRRLTTSFVTYVLDEEDRADSRTVSREAFRASAIDAIRCTSTSGLDRSPRNKTETLVHTLFRDAALRASWNQAYRNQAGADGYRTTVSVSGLALHKRFTKSESSVYAGIEVAFVDWAAPLTELALRKADVDYDDSGWIAFELVKPRVDVVAGLPIISEHLAASIGGSWRTAAPFRGKSGDSADSPTENAFTYLPFWSDDARVTRGSRAGFIEFSAGLHYVF